MAQKKVQSIKKQRFQPNIAILIFLLIILYLIVLFWSYVTQKQISIYEVTSAEIKDDMPVYGFIMRKEQVFCAENSGYVNYFNAEGNRVGVHDVVYTIDSTGEISDSLAEIQKKHNSTQGIQEMRNTIAEFENSFHFANYKATRDFSFKIRNALFQQNNGFLGGDLNEALKKAGKKDNFSKYYAAYCGAISYTIDGYEEINEHNLTPKILDEYGKIDSIQNKNEKKIEKGQPIYKLVTSNDWYLYVKLTDSYYEQLKPLNYVKVIVNKDNISFNASVELMEKDGCHIAKLGTSRFMERYINDRFLKIEFDLNSASGLKIPNSSIITKKYYILPKDVVSRGNGIFVFKQVLGEDGKVAPEKTEVKSYYVINEKYYVDANVVKGGDILKNIETNEDYIVSSLDTLYGVYCVNQGFCEFKPIDIRYKNKEYTIISPETAGGLAAYDHIVVDPSKIKEDDFIK